MNRLSLVVLLATSSISTAHAQVYTDAVAKMTELLAAQGQMAVTTPYSVEVEYEECRTSGHTSREGDGSPQFCVKKKRIEGRTKTEMGVLTPGPISISFPTPPTFGQVNYSSFPDNLIENATEMRNCTAGQSSFTISLSVSASRSNSVTLSKSVSNTIGGSVSGGIKPFGVGVNVTLNVQHGETTSQSNNVGNQDTYSIGNNGNVSVAPYRGIIASLRSYRIQSEIPFKVQAVVDAPVSQNDRGIKLASELVSTDARTFIIEGVLTSTDYSKGRLDMFDIDKPCEGRSGKSQADFTPSANSRLFLAPTKNFKLETSKNKR